MKHYPSARLCTRSRVFVCGIRIRYIVEWLNQTATIMNCGGVALIMDAVIQCLVRGCDEYGLLGKALHADTDCWFSLVNGALAARDSTLIDTIYDRPTSWETRQRLHQ
jgi:hypothetical protein